MNIDALMRSYAGTSVQIRGSGNAAAAGTAAATAASATATPAVADAGTATGTTTYDFTHMSRNEMKDAASALYASGQIDSKQLLMLQMAGPLGKVGPNGEFVPFTDAERAQIDSQPVNYLDLVQGALAGIESRGQTADPTSGYSDWQQILAALQSNQGGVSGVDIRA